MEYVTLGKTGLNVSRFCLGAAQFGAGVPKDEAFWQLDAFTDMGGNFIDTARIYNDWIPGERSRSEKVIGEWLKRSGKRDKVVIMTKGVHALSATVKVSRCIPENVEPDIKESCSCMGTDYIDLYLFHRDNPVIAAGLLLEPFEKARREGKIGHYGCSNWRLPRIQEAEAYARKAGIEGFSCNQLMWSLAEINTATLSDKTLAVMDKDTYGWHRGSGVSAFAFTSMAHGWFPKQEKGEAPPEKYRPVYGNEANLRILACIKKAAAEYGLTSLGVNLAYIAQQPFPSVPIISFSKKEQLEEALRVSGTVLPPELLKELNAIKGLA